LSTLIRSDFDAAANQFAADAIDILHLDGLHTEAAVRHDLDLWLPKLRPGGILLLHDIDVRQHDFGVGTVWDELQTRGRSFAFHIGPGLGVWQKPEPSPLPPLVESLLNRDANADAAIDYYRHAAQELHAVFAQRWHDGSIRDTAFAGQTIIQVFHSHDGTHSEENSVLARIGHGEWKNVWLKLPRGAGAAPLRIDFVSAYTVIDVASVSVSAGSQMLFNAATPAEFDQLTIAGDCRREPAEQSLRLHITGIDPQLYLPLLDTNPASDPLTVQLKLRVSAATASNPSAASSSVRP
jgi:hypothetical protein